MKARCHAPAVRAFEQRSPSIPEPGRARDGSFTLKETFLESPEGNKVLESLGQWVVVRGTATDPDATTYQLTASAASQPRFFLRVNNDTLQMLDGERREIATTGQLHA